MKSIKQLLTEIFSEAIQSVYELEMDPVIQLAGRPEYGDYQANFALRLAKQLQKKPVEIAKTIIGKLSENPIFEKLEASGPGFINITLANSFLSNALQALFPDECLGVNKTTSPKTIVVDYGGANVAKEMHVGHLRSAIIGDAIVRLLHFSGHRVIRQNHVGDWGTQFGMLIEYIIETGWQSDQPHSYTDLNTIYKKAKQRFDTDEHFAAKARARVVALQSGEAKTLAIWEQLVDESEHHFEEVYEKLGVLLTEDDMCGESFYNDRLADVTNELEKNGIAEIDCGALVIFLEGFVDPDGEALPLLIRKSDGGYLYATTDLTAIKYRIDDLKADRVIYVVDARQKQHFAMLFAAAEKAAWTKGRVKLEHVAYGAVLGEDHKPFKTRSGESIKLNDLLDEAKNRATQIILQKHPEWEADELSHTAKTVGVGALKYADLRSDKIKDYVFSWEKMLAFDGNTGPYLQNAFVRISAIFRKGGVDIAEIQKTSIQIHSPIEHTLAVKIMEFPDVTYAVADNLNLHSLCDYLYELASTFHRFYEQCPVLTDPSLQIQNSRLLLCSLTARTLQLGLNLLGIDVLEKM